MAISPAGQTIDGSFAATGDIARHSPWAAMRTELPIVAALLATAGVAWWSTAERMAGMDAGPGSALGSLGWFTGVWATMMAAMMLPSIAPATALLAASARPRLGRVLLFAGGYLLVWSLTGVGAYGLFEARKSTCSASSLTWHGGGRWLAVGILGLAALYQLTPLKRAFLSRCRSPLATPRRQPAQSTRPERFVMGLRNGGWCLGSSWALMAALFALGVMSLTWMASIAVLVALEKVGPWGRGARLASAGLLVVLAAASSPSRTRSRGSSSRLASLAPHDEGDGVYGIEPRRARSRPYPATRQEPLFTYAW